MLPTEFSEILVVGKFIISMDYNECQICQIRSLSTTWTQYETNHKQTTVKDVVLRIKYSAVTKSLMQQYGVCQQEGSSKWMKPNPDVNSFTDLGKPAESSCHLNFPLRI